MGRKGLHEKIHQSGETKAVHMHLILEKDLELQLFLTLLTRRRQSRGHDKQNGSSETS